MKNTIIFIAANACLTGVKGIFTILLVGLTGCALPGISVSPVVFDFGPGTLRAPLTHQIGAQPALALAQVQSSQALDSTDVLYRLTYSNAQQLRPYALARWSMPPAQLLQQRLGEILGQTRALLNPGDVAPALRPGALRTALAVRTLRIELEEFSQLFDTPEHSTGLLRLRATLLQPETTGERLIAQRGFVMQRSAPSANASGAVQALSAATDAAIQEIDAWLLTLEP
jgi:cholesterol transport system auxiliary component